MKRDLYDPSWSGEQTQAVNYIATLCTDMMAELLSGIDKISYDRRARTVAQEIRRFGETSKDTYRFILTNQMLWDHLVTRLFRDFGVPHTVPVYVSGMDVDDICHVYDKFLWEPITIEQVSDDTYDQVLRPALHRLVTDEFVPHHGTPLSPDFFFFFDWLMTAVLTDFANLTDLRQMAPHREPDFLCFGMAYTLGHFGKLPRSMMPKQAEWLSRPRLLQDRMMRTAYGIEYDTGDYVIAKARFLDEFLAFYRFYGMAPRLAFYADVRLVFQGLIDALQQADTAGSTIVPLLALPDTYRLFWFLIDLEPRHEDEMFGKAVEPHLMFHASPSVYTLVNK